MIEVKIFTGSIRHPEPIEKQVAETLEQSMPEGKTSADLHIFGMTQGHAAGEQITIAVIYEYR